MSPRNPEDFCVNCSQPFKLNSQRKKIVIRELNYRVSLVTEKESSKCLNKSVRVKNVLSSIYKIGRLMRKERCSIFSADKIIVDEGDKIGLCSKCAEALTLLYKYYAEFNLLTESCSYLSEKIKELDLIINNMTIASQRELLPTHSQVDEEIAITQSNSTSNIPSEAVHHQGNRHAINLSTSSTNDEREKPSSIQFTVSDVVHDHGYFLNCQPQVPMKHFYSHDHDYFGTPGTCTPNAPTKYSLCHDHDYLGTNDESSLSTDVELINSLSSSEKLTKSHPITSLVTGGNKKSKAINLFTSTATSRPPALVASQNVKTYSRLNTNQESGNGMVIEDAEAVNDFEEIPSLSCIPTLPNNVDEDIEIKSEFLQCTGCQKQFLFEKNLQAHRKICHFQRNRLVKTALLPSSSTLLETGPSDSTNVRCKECRETFPSQESLNVHMKRHICLCRHCDTTFENKLEFIAHWTIVHNQDKPFHCKLCKMNFTSRTGLKNHQHQQPPPGTTKCVRTKKKRIRIRKKVPKDTNVNLECPTCLISFKSLYYLQRHLMLHGAEHYKCKLCKKDFFSEVSVRAHVKKWHGGDPKVIEFVPRSEMDLLAPQRTAYKCQKCDKVLSSSSGLKIHEMTHLPIKCPHCPKRFETDEESSNHLTRCRGLLKPYACACGRTFSRGFLLTCHIKTYHSTDRPYKCTMCSASFPLKKSLQGHIKRHGNDKPYFCPHEGCPKRYVNMFSLKFHLNRHAGIKAHLCSICGLAFTRDIILKTHMNVHMGTLPFECSECPEKFPSRDFLKSHVKRRHAERPYSCGLCAKKFVTEADLLKHPPRCNCCEECGVVFKRHDTFLKHMRGHTNGMEVDVPKSRRPKSNRIEEAIVDEQELSEDVNGDSGI